MLKSIRASIKDTFIFGLGNVAVKVVGFILIPLYTNPEFFSVDDFGIIGILDISGLLLISIIASSVPQSLARWYWDQDHTGKQKDIFFMSIVTQTVISLLFCLLLIPFSGGLSSMLFGGKTDWSFTISLIIISSSLQSINNVINTLIRLQARSILFSVVNFSKLLIVLLLTVYFIKSGHKGIAGIYLAQVIGNLSFIIVLIPFILRNSKAHFDLNIWKPMMVYGMPLIMASFSGILLNVIDRYSLNALAPLEFVAIYTLAYKISSSLKLIFIDTIKLAIFPHMVKQLNSPDNKRFYSKAMLYTSFVLMFGVIAVSLFSLEVMKFLAKTPDLWTASTLVPFLSLSFFFVNMREVSIYGLIAVKKTRKITSIVIVSSILNLLLNLLFIPLWNAMGAAFATLLSQLFYSMVMHRAAQRAYYIPYENTKLLMLMITGTILSLTGLLLTDFTLPARLIIKTLCLFSFPFILYFMNFYEPIELQSIRAIVKKWSDLKHFSENVKSLKRIKDEF